MERDRDRERERDRGGRDREERRPRPPDRRNTTMSLGDYMNPKDKAAQRGGGGGGGGVPARSQCTPLTNLLEETPAESLATELIIVESSESVETALQVHTLAHSSDTVIPLIMHTRTCACHPQLLGEFRFTSLPVRTNDGRMDKMIDIYDVSTLRPTATRGPVSVFPPRWPLTSMSCVCVCRLWQSPIS
jgi:hypothetical protein